MKPRPKRGQLLVDLRDAVGILFVFLQLPDRFQPANGKSEMTVEVVDRPNVIAAEHDQHVGRGPDYPRPVDKVTIQRLLNVPGQAGGVEQVRVPVGRAIVVPCREPPSAHRCALHSLILATASRQSNPPIAPVSSCSPSRPASPT